MQNKDNVFNHNENTVEYRFARAKQDRRHLLIVFSGFATAYDFMGNTASGCRSNILWIKDSFDNNYSYYLCKKMNFSIEESVIALIESIRINLSLNKSQCTLLGFSKGGSAALYYGLKYDYKNIISSCPQVNIGSYVSQHWKKSSNYMIGNSNIQEKIATLDSLLPDLLASNRIRESNIYLISSPDDIQYDSEIKPYLPFFWKSNNFNFIFTQSKLAWQHSRVTRYNIPIILSIIYAHGEGIFPRLGSNVNGEVEYPKLNNEEIIKEIKNKKNLVAELFTARIELGKIYLNGSAFILGYECDSFSKIKQLLIIKGNGIEKSIPLGKNLNRDISYDHFDRVYIDYSAGNITNYKNIGIDINDLPYGSYILNVQVMTSGLSFEGKISALKNLDLMEVHDGKIITIRSLEDEIILEVNPVINDEDLVCFGVSNRWLRNDKLHIDGHFIVKGIIQNSWGDSKFILTLKNNNETFNFPMGKQTIAPESIVFFNRYSYAKSGYSTLGQKGISLLELPDSVYDIYVTLIKDGIIYSKKCEFCISTEDSCFID